MASEAKKCAHATCSCMAPEGKTFCSTACEDAKGVTTLGCDCGHAGCSGGQL